MKKVTTLGGLAATLAVGLTVPTLAAAWCEHAEHFGVIVQQQLLAMKTLKPSQPKAKEGCGDPSGHGELDSLR